MNPTSIASDPVAMLEHTHDRLTKLAMEVAVFVRAGGKPERLLPSLQKLHDGLLEHFAAEEEGLYPYVRAQLPSKAPVVDALEAGHDAICGAVVRLLHSARSAKVLDRAGLAVLYDRFADAYARHSRAEAQLLAELGRVLDARHRAELGSLLRGL